MLTYTYTGTKYMLENTSEWRPGFKNRIATTSICRDDDAEVEEAEMSSQVPDDRETNVKRC